MLTFMPRRGSSPWPSRPTSRSRSAVATCSPLRSPTTSTSSTSMPSPPRSNPRCGVPKSLPAYTKPCAPEVCSPPTAPRVPSAACADDWLLRRAPRRARRWQARDTAGCSAYTLNELQYLFATRLPIQCFYADGGKRVGGHGIVELRCHLNNAFCWYGSLVCRTACEHGTGSRGNGYVAIV